MTEYNDYELVGLAQEFDEDASYLLYKKYSPLFYQLSSKYSSYLVNRGMGLEDIIQECYLTFGKAIFSFREDNNVTFYSYVKSCIEHCLISMVRASGREKIVAQNKALSLDDFIDDEDNSSYLEQLVSLEEPFIDMLVNEESYDKLLASVLRVLTPLEECVLLLKVQDYSNVEIASVLDKSYKCIDNALQRIKLKVREINAY